MAASFLEIELYPPAHICQALYRKNPHLRLAWKGHYNGDPQDLNQGCFALVRLVPLRAVGDRNNPLTLKEFWDCTLVQTSEFGFETVRDDKGPIFNRWGGTRPDWDAMERAPVIAMCADPSYDMTHYDVYGGRLVHAISIVPLAVDKRDQARALVAKGRGIDSDVRDTVEASIDHIFYEANKPGQSSAIMAKKHIKSTYGNYEAQAEARKERAKMENYFLKKARLEGAL